MSLDYQTCTYSPIKVLMNGDRMYYVGKTMTDSEVYGRGRYNVALSSAFKTEERAKQQIPFIGRPDVTSN